MRQGKHPWAQSIVLVAMVVTAAVPGVGSAQNNGTDRAVAHVDVQEFNNFRWDVSARSNFNGTEPSGSFRFEDRNQDPNFVISGEVTCLQVAGNVALVGGVVTDVRGGTTNVNAVQIAMTDSGKFGTTPDLFGAFFTIFPPGTPPPCPSNIFQGPVIEGEVIVRDALN